ncbi:hypothetical protein, partial [Cupriavidus sp. D384]|uniref:hypothetical protein n=1 Tax=Cupriavidus sp. D384 TaxID=1538095 RepID=UPI001E2FB19B
MTTTTTMVTITITATGRATAGMGTDFPLLSRWRARGIGFWPALCLICCLLLTQHVGLVHRVVHGGLLNTPQAAAQIASTNVDNAADVAEGAAGTDSGHAEPFSLKLGLHSCVLFDGATLADTHFGSFVLPSLAFGKPVKPANLAWRWPDLPAARAFHSR